MGALTSIKHTSLQKGIVNASTFIIQCPLDLCFTTSTGCSEFQKCNPGALVSASQKIFKEMLANLFVENPSREISHAYGMHNYGFSARFPLPHHTHRNQMRAVGLRLLILLYPSSFRPHILSIDFSPGLNACSRSQAPLSSFRPPHR